MTEELEEARAELERLRGIEQRAIEVAEGRCGWGGGSTTARYIWTGETP